MNEDIELVQEALDYVADTAVYNRAQPAFNRIKQQLQAREWAPDGSRKVHIGFYDQIGVNLSPSEYQQGMIRHSVYNICAAETGEVVAWVKPKHLAEIIVALINS